MLNSVCPLFMCLLVLYNCPGVSLYPLSAGCQVSWRCWLWVLWAAFQSVSQEAATVWYLVLEHLVILGTCFGVWMLFWEPVCEGIELKQSIRGSCTKVGRTCFVYVQSSRVSKGQVWISQERSKKRYISEVEYECEYEYGTCCAHARSSTVGMRWVWR